MNRVVVLVVVGVGSAAGCALPPYASGAITCDPNGAPCPEGYACVDVHRDDRPVCVQIGCGDGNVNVSNDQAEQCDDANDNDLDMCSGCATARFVPSVAVGFGPGGADAPATALGQPMSVAADRDGNVWVGAAGVNLIERRDAQAGALTTFAGNGSLVDIGATDDVPANRVAAPLPIAIAVDGVGNVYFADLFENAVRRVDAVTGNVTTVVAPRPADELIGTAPQATATTARARALAVDGDGVLFFVDDDLPAAGEGSGTIRRVRRVDPVTGEMTTVQSGVLDGEFLGLGDVKFDDSGTFYAFGTAGVLVQPPQQAPVLVRLRSGCAPVAGDQKRFAVTPDGKTGFYASESDVFSVDLASGACAKLATVPSTNVAPPIGNPFVAPGPLDVAFLPAQDGGAGAVLAADPTNGVVWRIPADQSSVLALAPPAFVGAAAAGDDFAAGVVVDLALATDGRATFSETKECRDLLPPDAPRLSQGNFEIFASFPEQHRIVESNCANQIFILAGDGAPGSGGDGGDPLRAQLQAPVAAVRGLDGVIYVDDRDAGGSGAIRAIAAAPPLIDTFLGPGDVVDGAPLGHPSGLARDDSGRLLIADSDHDRVVRVDPAGAAAAVTLPLGPLSEPSALVFLPYAFSDQLLQLAPACDVPRDTPTADPCGILVVAERSGHRVRAFALDPLGGFTFDLAGDGSPGDADSSAAVARGELRFPRGLMIDLPSQIADPTGGTKLTANLLVVDGVHRLRRLSLTGFQLLPPAITTSLETVTARDGKGIGLTSSDDAVDGTGSLRGPSGLVLLDAGRALVVEGVTGRLRLLDLGTHALATVSGLPAGLDVGETPVAAAEAVPLDAPAAVALDGGVLYASEPALSRVRRFQLVDPSDPSTWTTDVLPLTPGAVRAPSGLAVDPDSHDLFITDEADHVVLRVDAGGDVGVVAGKRGQRGFAGDGGVAKNALLNAPEGVLFTAQAGRRLLFVADTGNERVRRVDLDSGLITTVLGDGSSGSGGEGAPSSGFPVASPRGLAVDARGNLFVTSSDAIRIVQADTFFDRTSEPSVADGGDAVATLYGKPPRRTFPEPVTRCVSDVVVAPEAKGRSTRLYALDSCLGLVLQLDRSE